MGRLAGFGYRETIKRLKRLGFDFDRHARGESRNLVESGNPQANDHTESSWRPTRRHFTGHSEAGWG